MINSKSILFIFVLFYSQNHFEKAFAQETFVLSSQTKYYSLDSGVFFLEDKNSNFDINQVQELEFSALPETKLNFGYSMSSFWFKVKLKSTDSLNNDWLLEIPYPILDSITIYAQNQSNTWDKTYLGDNFEFSQRHLDYRNPTYSLNLDFQKTKTFYIRVRTQSSSQIPMFVRHENTFFADKMAEEILYGLFFGMLLALIIYHFFLLFTIRENIYIYYILVLIASMIIFSSTTGHIIQYILPKQPVFYRYFTDFAFSIGLMMVSLFTRDFLNVKKTSKFLYFVFNILITLSFFSIILVVAIPQLYLNIVFAFGLIISLVLCLLTACWSWYKGNAFARFFCLAWTVYVLGAIVIIFRNAGLLPNNFITSHSVEIGFLLQVILFSIAIGDKLQQSKTVQKNK